MKIVVLAGGTSTERTVSITSGTGICKALRQKGHQAILVDIFCGIENVDRENPFPSEYDVDAASEYMSAFNDRIEQMKKERRSFFGPNVLKLCEAADIVFLGLHGANGEDGKVQATFDLMGIKYTGTGYLSSALAMDKGITKQMFMMNHVPTPRGVSMVKSQMTTDLKALGMEFPVVVKTCCGGSSVGVYIVNDQKEYEEALTQPSLMIEFMTKRMNLPSQESYMVIAEWDKIMATNQPVPDLTGWSCIGAIDYASIRDFAGVGLLFKNGNKRIWLHHTFICHKALELPGRQIKFDIELAKEKGLCTVLKTDSIDPKKIAEWFIEQSEKYNILNIYADSYRKSILKDAFNEYGLPLETVRSGPITHALIHPLMEKLFADEDIIFGDDPMMRWYTNNVYVETDKKGNKTFLKIEPILRKTDGFFAFMHALSKDEEIPQYYRPMNLDCYSY